MNKNFKILFLILVLTSALVVAGIFFSNKKTDTEVSNTASVYSNDIYKIRFKYPSILYLKERETGTKARPQLSIILLDNSQENIDLLEGRSIVEREGPTSINIDVYQNPAKLSSESWLKNDTNWTIANSKASEVEVANKRGVYYTWSGLYEGKTIVVTEGEFAYVFTVTWMTKEDSLLKDFDNLLRSLEFANSF